ncbi:L-seryl-tRNA(Sec) selenium transferase [soil metagenome]
MTYLAALPSVQEVLRDPAFQRASAGLADVYRTRLVRQVIQQHRQKLRVGHLGSSESAQVAEMVVHACIREAEAIQQPSPRRVINGTGVLIHTNLGRAPLGELIQDLDTRVLGGYTDLEWEAASQQRGNRDLPLQRQLQLLTGAEGALVVNNCASALFLALNTVAGGKEVLVSRSELVEIGGSFRVPEIMEASGCRLREVGTTNKTRLSDFQQHARSGTSVLLKVHQSNFVQRGFVEQVAVEEMVTLGERLGIPVIEDNGSGLLEGDDTALLTDEPRVVESLQKGLDVVCCSADKLFGSIQAGILLGKAEWIGPMRKNPLYRVLRLDKVRMALLDRTLKRYLSGQANELPVWRLFRASIDELEAQIQRLHLPGPETRWACCKPVPLLGKLGGGSNPEASFPSLGLELLHRDLSAEALKRHFASRAIPIVGYVQQDRFYLDVRTFFPDDFAELQQALDELSAAA